ncbi:MAG: L,D-transpeptidase [Akkermansiaceae bacterium]|jgi:lipoprotein-anchoring transpeptidase ErfK/SrfK|nr:L,D-transpeptidase [Akkermansiaceae bacterium]
MKKNYLFPLLLAIAASVFLTSCGNKPPKPNPAQTEIKSAVRVNPYPRGTYEHFKFDSYPGTTRTWKNTALLAKANPSNTKVRIDLSSQRGFLLVNDEVAMDYRVSTGSSRHKTPTGDYKIIEKIREKRSNLYGKILNASGAVVQSNADARKDTVPAGGSFRGASMPYWMRLTRTGIGMHQGNVNRRYASHGCIRTHYSAVPIVYSKTNIGTPVTVTN